jgi:hypothetical protein
MLGVRAEVNCDTSAGTDDAFDTVVNNRASWMSPSVVTIQMCRD